MVPCRQPCEAAAAGTDATSRGVDTCASVYVLLCLMLFIMMRTEISIIPLPFALHFGCMPCRTINILTVKIFDHTVNKLTSVSLVAGRRSKGSISLGVKLTRLDEKADFRTENHAHLIVGSIHDDRLLADESLIFERFPSPLTLQITTGNAAGEKVSP